MVSPTRRRAGVRWAREAYQLPERRACRVMGFSRSTERYQSVRPSREPLRARLKELAAVRVSYGYRRLHIMLRREGWPVDRKLIERLYREEGLTLKRKKPKAPSQCCATRAIHSGCVGQRAVGHGFRARYAVQQPDGAGADGSGCVQQGVRGT